MKRTPFHPTGLARSQRSVLRCAPAWPLLMAACGWPAAPLAAQSVWELTPYAVHVVLSPAAAPQLTPQLQQDVARAIRDKADAVYGPFWDLEVTLDPSPLAAAAAASESPPAVEELPRVWQRFERGENVYLPVDKLLFVRLGAHAAGFTVTARELDLTTLIWNFPYTAQVPQPGMLGDEAFLAVTRAFAPLARVESVEDKKTVLRIRGGNLPRRDASLPLAPPGVVFQPVIRQTDSKGELKGVQALDWTFLYALPPQPEDLTYAAPAEDGAEEAPAGGFGDVPAAAPAEKAPAQTLVDSSRVVCSIHSGLRNPLSNRRRGRVEQLALAMVPPQGATRLELISRSQPARPLAGYEVFSHPPNDEETVLLGRTDQDGRIDVPPGDIPLRILLVRSGGEYLGRLPLLPGLKPTAQALLPDDDERLAVEGFITSVQESIVDTIARREVLLLRIRKRIMEGQVAETAPLMEELRRLRTRAQFNAILDERQKTIFGSDQQLRRQIKKLFDDTRLLLGNYLDPAALTTIEEEVKAAGG